MLSERAIQQEVERLIQNNAFLDCINPSHIKDITNLTEIDELTLPTFSIDEYIRLKCMISARDTLESLTELNLLTNDLNISTTTAEILRPDIVGFNHHDKTITIFELKKSKQTERQALTELLAYEHEIKNTLPFLSNYEVTFVLISTEWSILLQHAVGSAIAWSNKKLLCLELKAVNEKYSFNIIRPEAWQLTGTTSFPVDGLTSVTISLSNCIENISNEQITTRLMLALTTITREADRAGLHGFAVLWKDEDGQNNPPYSITFCSTSPLAFFKYMLENKLITKSDGHLSAKISDVINSSGTESGIGSLIKVITKSFNPIISTFCTPSFEGYVTWESAKQALQYRARPQATEFWGLIGDYARDYISHPAVLNGRSTLFKAGISDWREPYTGIWLIQNLFQRQFLKEGFIQLSDAFKFGLAVGQDGYLRYVAKNSSKRPKNLDSAMFWNFTTLESYLDELIMLADSATEIERPEINITISSSADIDTDFQPIIDWFENDVLKQNKFYVSTFRLGRSLYPVVTADSFQTSNFISLFNNPPAKSALSQLISTVISHAKENISRNESLKKELISLCMSKVQTGNPTQNLTEQLDKSHISVLSEIVRPCMDLANLTIDGIYHRLKPISVTAIDWSALKNGIAALYQKGFKFPAISISADGTFGTAIYDKSPEACMLRPIDNIEDEVYVADASPGYLMIRIEKWADLTL